MNRKNRKMFFTGHPVYINLFKEHFILSNEFLTFFVNKTQLLKNIQIITNTTNFTNKTILKFHEIIAFFENLIHI